MRIVASARIAGMFPHFVRSEARDMNFPWLPLAFGLCLLMLMMVVCRLVNARGGIPRWNGALLFLALCCLALLLDFALTMIFASASFHERVEYERYASRSDWGRRVLTYLIQMPIALVLAVRFRRRQQIARCKQRQGIQIQTSAYTRSELPL
jgi:hypothetical protein